MQTKRPHRFRRDSNGVALVELAILFPFLATLVFGSIDLGRGYVTYEQMKNAAREGALYARNFPYAQKDDGSGNCTDPNNISYKANAEAGGAALTITVSVGGQLGTPATTPALGCDTTDAPPGPGTAISVTASKPFSLLTPLVAGLVHISQISATVTVQEAR